VDKLKKMTNEEFEEYFKVVVERFMGYKNLRRARYS